MDLSRIRPFAHKHCRFKLRNGKEVFGVIWEVETGEVPSGREADKHLFFASVRDYERLQSDPEKPVSVVDMPPEEIIQVERLAS
jgi:hypothetical protein